MAFGSDGFASYANPAMMSWQTAFTGPNGSAASLVAPAVSSRLKFSYGWIFMHPSFLPIQNVVVENHYASGLPQNAPGNFRKDSVDTSYRNTVGQELGVSYIAAPEFHQLAFGVTTFVPWEQLALVDSGETYIPEYVLYRARTQRPQFEVAASAQATEHFSLGVGIHFGSALTSNGTVLVQTDSSLPSTLRISASAKTKASPYFGLAYSSEPTSTNPTTTAGFVFRLPLSSTNQLNVSSGARGIGNIATLDFNFKALSTVYYDPMSLELGGTVAYTDSARLFLEADYQFWSKFEAPSVSIQDPRTTTCDSGSPCGILISSSQNPAYAYHNILIPKVAHEWKLGTQSIRLGYAYRPSILAHPNNGAGNYLDPPKHLINAGYGMEFKKFLSFDTPCNVDFHASYQQLVTQKITKSQGDELGQGVGDLKIGAPGYEAGGKIFGGGVSLSLAI